MSRLRPHLFALVPASIVVVYLLPIIVGNQTWYRRDLFNYHLGVKTAQARAMREGVLPLVDPVRASGQAVVGNLNNVALYPDNLLYLVTPADLGAQRPLVAASAAGAGRLVLAGARAGNRPRGVVGRRILLRAVRASSCRSSTSTT